MILVSTHCLPRCRECRFKVSTCSSSIPTPKSFGARLRNMRMDSKKHEGLYGVGVRYLHLTAFRLGHLEFRPFGPSRYYRTPLCPAWTATSLEKQTLFASCSAANSLKSIDVIMAVTEPVKPPVAFGGIRVHSFDGCPPTESFQLSDPAAAVRIIPCGA